MHSTIESKPNKVTLHVAMDEAQTPANCGVARIARAEATHAMHSKHFFIALQHWLSTLARFVHCCPEPMVHSFVAVSIQVGCLQWSPHLGGTWLLCIGVLAGSPLALPVKPASTNLQRHPAELQQSELLRRKDYADGTMGWRVPAYG